MRYFNGQMIELLAPAGTYEILKEIVHTNCDAIYFGGRILNMRMIRKGYNLSDDELVSAVQLIHQHNKKAYITINNLNSQNDLIEAINYLQFLNDIVKPDAIIVQDFAIVQLIEEMDLQLKIHSSVMMNVHNVHMVQALHDLGIERVVVSRDCTLNDVKSFKQAVPAMEFEYFVHGDMCTVHGSQCYYSSILFGMSSNRGKCLKPCRWPYHLKYEGKRYDVSYPLAAKDMYMYEHLPELINSGVNSFKIEGRMRDVDFLKQLISIYGEAIDRYIENPLSFDRTKHQKDLYDSRKRDFSQAYAFGKPGLSNINERYEGTGKFYSTGKMFSIPTEERSWTIDRIQELIDSNKIMNSIHQQLSLSVKVETFEQVIVCLEKKVNYIYLAVDSYLPFIGLTNEQYQHIAKNKQDSKVILALPKIMDELDFSQVTHFLEQYSFVFDGLAVTNIGAIHAFKRFTLPLYSDTALNLYNDVAIQFYKDQGLDFATLSIELPFSDLVEVISKSVLPTEVVVHGNLEVMHLEHDLFENLKVFDSFKEEDNQYVPNSTLVLATPVGEYPVYKDRRGRNHIHQSKELNLLPLIPVLRMCGLSTCRIEGRTYSVEQLNQIIDVYQASMNEELTPEEAMELLKPNFLGFTLNALTHEVN